MGLAVKGSDKCRVHGGVSRRGIAHPAFRNGKHSKYLPKRLAERYASFLQNDNFLSLREDIALLDARIAELLESLDNRGGNSTFFQRLLDGVKRIDEAERRRKKALQITQEQERKAELEKATADFLEAIDDITATVRAGAKEWATWRDILQVVEQRRRLADTERRLLIDSQQYVKLGDVLILSNALLMAVRGNVTDPAALQKIQNEFTRIVGQIKTADG